MSTPRTSILGKDELPLPSPAEDLSADDDLLSWILVDQLGCMPNSRLGVHPQENKFVGPTFNTEEVLNIVREVSRKRGFELTNRRSFRGM
jgi:histone-lysine N-methyltransferase SUV420H